MSTLVGVLVRENRLKIDAPAPVPAWGNVDDPRHAITLGQLLRMTSGLAIEETGSGFDPASRMLFTERDMAGFAESQPLARTPGTQFEYSDANTLVVSRIVRDATGGSSKDVGEFAQRDLFDLLGMHSVVFETDATGTPVGAVGVLASARDWAKLGELYAHDGVVNGQRILPEGWVRYSAKPTLGSAYGAGFWTNAGSGLRSMAPLAASLPGDMLFASGQLGQRVYVIPSEDLVIVRLGVTQKFPDFDFAGDTRLIQDVLGSLHSGS
jgi:CubicO group peptidase (beta-lactamase class C family)